MESGGGVTHQDPSFSAMVAPGIPCTSPYIQSRPPFKDRRLEAEHAASSRCLEDRGLHSSCDAGHLGSGVARERRLKWSRASDCSSQGPQRAPSKHERRLQPDFYPRPAEQGQELAITVSAAHKKSLAPLSNWHKRPFWPLPRTLLSSWSQTGTGPLLSIKVCPAGEHRLISRVLMEQPPSKSPPS